MEHDIVCGSEVDPTDALCVEYEGRLFHFCSEECLDAFRDEPDLFADDAPASASPPLLH